MSPGISISLHFWRGIGPLIQRELFYVGFRLGIFTISICRVCVIDSYAKIRGAMLERVAVDEAQVKAAAHAANSNR